MNLAVSLTVLVLTFIHSIAVDGAFDSLHGLFGFVDDCLDVSLLVVEAEFGADNVKEEGQGYVPTEEGDGVPDHVEPLVRAEVNEDEDEDPWQGEQDAHGEPPDAFDEGLLRWCDDASVFVFLPVEDLGLEEDTDHGSEERYAKADLNNRMVVERHSLVELFAKFIAFLDYRVLVVCFIHLNAVCLGDSKGTNLNADADAHRNECSNQFHADFTVASFKVPIKKVIEPRANDDLEECGEPNSKKPSEDDLVPGVDGDNDSREPHHTDVEKRDEAMEQGICDPDVACSVFVLDQQVEEES